MEINSEEMGSTNIRVSTTTRDRLAKLGGYNDTMDAILVKILDELEELRKERKK